MIKLKVKRLFSFITSIILTIGCSSRINAEIWDLQNCIDTIKGNHCCLESDREKYRLFCLKNYVLLSLYLRRVDANPSARISRTLSCNIYRELKKARVLSGEDKEEWLVNLSVIREAFMSVWKSFTYGDLFIPTLENGSGLCDPPAHSRHFKHFVKKSNPRPSKEVREKFTNVCLRKYYILDRYVRYLSMTDKDSVPYPSLLFSESELREVSKEIDEAKKYCAEDSDEFIAIIRTMRDKLLLMVAFNIPE